MIMCAQLHARSSRCMDAVRAASDTRRHEARGPLDDGGPARRGAALPADERHLLLPAPSSARPGGWSCRRSPDCLMFHVVTAGRCWLETSRGESPPRCSRATSRSCPTARAIGSSASPARADGAALRPSARAGQRAVRGPPPRRRRRAHEPRLRRRALRSPGRAPPGRAPAARSSASRPPASEQEWIQGTLRFMAAEARALRPGGETVITRLADILVIQAIRSWIEQDPAAQDGLARRAAGPADRTRHRAHPSRARARPGPWRRWRPRSRCRARRSPPASRSASASRPCTTSRAGGCTSRRAGCGTATRHCPLVASRLGYQSEAAFSRAFKRFVGVPPGAVRLRDRRPA